MKIHEVFGTRPQVNERSYIDRKNLDEELRKLIDRKQSHIAIRGASKSGKSWLRQRVLFDPIVVQCRLSYSVADIYKYALSQLGITIDVETSTSRTFKGSITAVAEAGLPLLAKATGELNAEGEFTKESTKKYIGKDIDDLKFIADILRSSGRTLVVEDFHYLPTREQKSFSFDMKALWDYGVFIIIVGVWISENMLITLNSDLSDRIEEISVTWSDDELKQVLKKGCQSLNLRTSDTVATEMARVSYGSVGLLQKLALRMIDDELGIHEGLPDGQEFLISEIVNVHDAAMHVAEQLNQLYQAFAKRVSEGIRNRSNSTGIYAHAIAAIMGASDHDLLDGLGARKIYEAAHARQSRVQYGNLKIVLARFPELQVDEDGRGLVLAYDIQDEKISVVDKQLLLYRKFATVRWPWEELILESDSRDGGYDC